MHVIYGYSFEVADVVLIDMPKGAKVLSVDVQPDMGPCVWAIVDDEVGQETRVFHVRGTGQHLGPEEAQEEFIGTFRVLPSTWHLFADTPIPRRQPGTETGAP